MVNLFPFMTNWMSRPASTRTCWTWISAHPWWISLAQPLYALRAACTAPKKTVFFYFVCKTVVSFLLGPIHPVLRIMHVTPFPSQLFLYIYPSCPFTLEYCYHFSFIVSTSCSFFFISSQFFFSLSKIEGNKNVNHQKFRMSASPVLMRVGWRGKMGEVVGWWWWCGLVGGGNGGVDGSW